MQRNIMPVNWAVSGTEADVFFTIDGERYHVMSMTKFKAEVKIAIDKVPVLGSRMEQNKYGKMSGSFSGTAHYNSSVMREYYRKYKDTGRMPNVEIQVVNEDEASEAGRQTVVLKRCLFEGGVLSQFDENATHLDEEIKGVFGDFEIPDKFNARGGQI